MPNHAINPREKALKQSVLTNNITLKAQLNLKWVLDTLNFKTGEKYFLLQNLLKQASNSVSSVVSLANPSLALASSPLLREPLAS